MIEQADDIKFWREKCGEYEELYRKQKEMTKVYKDALYDLLHYDHDQITQAKEKIRELEGDLL